MSVVDGPDIEMRKPTNADRFVFKSFCSKDV